MMRSEEKLPVKVGLFYQVWVCDAHLSGEKQQIILEMYTQ